jgi:hypothetical protein
MRVQKGQRGQAGEGGGRQQQEDAGVMRIYGSPYFGVKPSSRVARPVSIGAVRPG